MTLLVAERRRVGGREGAMVVCAILSSDRSLGRVGGWDMGVWQVVW
jgi:hypothetical protein